MVTGLRGNPRAPFFGFAPDRLKSTRLTPVRNKQETTPICLALTLGPPGLHATTAGQDNAFF